MRDTMDMAREAELDELLEQMPRIAKKFKAFEALVRADEREACAKVCEEYETEDDITTTWLNIVADDIRARGNT